ncbi:hypothetical protein F7725_013002 [Dissostichus mawsoni]|uniref:Uncharacterized protein n=1 Tax=Dissostichus mawsoni TaxID=36200 RepID=A0A7J5YPB2_DISMA|nr:hypothetical protein F7725_013002 [Dissostichus mawsoni]
MAQTVNVRRGKIQSLAVPEGCAIWQTRDVVDVAVKGKRSCAEPQGCGGRWSRADCNLELLSSRIRLACRQNAEHLISLIVSPVVREVTAVLLDRDGRKVSSYSSQSPEGHYSALWREKNTGQWVKERKHKPTGLILAYIPLLCLSSHIIPRQVQLLSHNRQRQGGRGQLKGGVVAISQAPIVCYRIMKHRVAIESASSAVSRAGSSHMITVLIALYDLIHPFSAQRQGEKGGRCSISLCPKNAPFMERKEKSLLLDETLGAQEKHLVISDDEKENLSGIISRIDEKSRTAEQSFYLSVRLKTLKRVQRVICERRYLFLSLFHWLTSRWNQGAVLKHSAQRGQRFLGYLFTAWTLRPQSPCRKERGKTDESSKKGNDSPDPLLSSPSPTRRKI